MKKVIFILPAMLFLCATLQAQDFSAGEPVIAKQDTVIIKQSGDVVIVDTKEDGRTTQVSYHKKRSKNPRNFYFGMAIDFGLCSYGSENVFTGNSGDDDFLVINTSKSRNFTLYPAMGEMKITRWLSLTGGIGVEWANYFFEEGWTMVNSNGVTVPSDQYIINGYNTLSKSKLLVVNMNVPVMVQFEVPNKRHSSFWGWNRGFFVQAGAIGSVKIGSHTKVKIAEDGNKIKDFSSFNLNLLRYELTARIGYSWLGAFVNYQMTPMFEKNHGPELYPFSAGISLQFNFD